MSYTIIDQYGQSIPYIRNHFHHEPLKARYSLYVKKPWSGRYYPVGFHSSRQYAEDQYYRFRRDGEMIILVAALSGGTKTTGQWTDTQQLNVPRNVPRVENNRVALS